MKDTAEKRLMEQLKSLMEGTEALDLTPDRTTRQGDFTVAVDTPHPKREPLPNGITRIRKTS
jgi:hypothetical protein